MPTKTVVALPDDLRAARGQRAPNPPERDELIAAAKLAQLDRALAFALGLNRAMLE